MINKNLTISKTILFNFVNLNILKCFYPGGGNGKKVGEEITKKVMEKCIGTGCENKKPPTVTSKTPQVQKPPQIQKSPAVSPVNSSEKENKFSGITQHNAKEMAKPIKSIGENAKKSNKDYTEKNNTENVKKDNSTVNAVLQKHGVNNPIPITKQENPNIQAAIKASLGINPTDIDESTDIFIVPNNIPIPPPPPPVLPSPIDKDKDKGVLAAPPVSKIFSEELQDVVKDRENRALEIQNSLQKLEEQNLLKIQGDEMKLKPEFYSYLKKKPETLVEISTDKINVNNLIFNVGMLEVTQIQETVFLSGVQNHVIVWVYAEYQDSKIVLGYFTSDKTASVKLSNQQPFNLEELKNKVQMFVPLNNPLLIRQEEHLKNLSITQLADGSTVDQQKIGQDYVNSKDVYNKLQEQLKNKIQEDKLLVEVYQGIGITTEDIDNVLQNKDIQNQINAKKFFQEYLKLQKQQKKIDKWFFNIQNTDPKVYEELQKLIKEHENK